MSTRPSLSAEPRTVIGKKVSVLRRLGKLPAIVYGHGHASEPIQIDAHEFEVLRRHTGRNALLDLKVGSGKARPVLLQGIHESPVTRKPLHVDLFIVKMTEELAVDVPMSVIGESPAVTLQGGNLLHLRDTVHVRALPADLPSIIEVDISRLTDFETTLHVSDLIVPARVTIVTDPTEAILRVQAPRLDTEAVPGAAEVAAAAAATAEAAEETTEAS